MLKSKLYKKYFPITEKNTIFSEDEKKVLYSWARLFRKEIALREYDLAKKGFDLYISYDMTIYNRVIMVDMINKV